MKICLFIEKYAPVISAIIICLVISLPLIGLALQHKERCMQVIDEVEKQNISYLEKSYAVKNAKCYSYYIDP